MFHDCCCSIKTENIQKCYWVMCVFIYKSRRCISFVANSIETNYKYSYKKRYHVMTIHNNSNNTYNLQFCVWIPIIILCTYVTRIFTCYCWDCKTEPPGLASPCMTWRINLPSQSWSWSPCPSRESGLRQSVPTILGLSVQSILGRRHVSGGGWWTAITNLLRGERGVLAAIDRWDAKRVCVGLEIWSYV